MRERPSGRREDMTGLAQPSACGKRINKRRNKRRKAYL
jgi:hypothetical protein